MAMYSDGFSSIVLTKEGAARANELRANGLEVKVTHIRVYRTPTLLQNIPYQFTGLESKQTVDSWTQLPNNETSFELIENFPSVPMPGYLLLIGTLGAEVGTFSYDAVGVFLEDDTLYAIGVTSHLLTKRKASVGTMSNIQELSFNIAHSTVDEVVDFQIQENIINYSNIDELEFVHQLPKAYDESKRMYRLTSGALKTYLNNSGFMTTIASQANMKLVGSNKITPVWVLSDYIRLFDKLNPTFKLTANNKVQVDVSSSTLYPIEFISDGRTYILSLADPDNKIPYSALKLTLDSRVSDATGYHFIFSVADVSLGLTEDTSLQGILSTRSDDGIYQDSIKTALRRMANLQYAQGRRFKADAQSEPSDILKPFLGVDTVWKKLDNRIEVTTSQYDNRLINPGIVQPIINKDGDTKHMKLRASNIWMRTTDNELAPTLALDRYVCFYNTSAVATIQAAGYPDGALIAFYVRPVRSEILKNPTKVYGYAAVSNGVATFNIEPSWNNVTNNDTIVVGLVGYPEEETLLALEILELESFFSTDLEGNDKLTTIPEGATVYYHVRTRLNQPVNATVYTTLSGSTTNNIDDFVSGVPDYFDLVDGAYVLKLEVKADNLTEGNEQLVIAIGIDAAYSRILTDATLSIQDTSLTPLPKYEIYFASDPAGTTKLTGTIELGSTVYLIVKALNVPPLLTINIDLSGTLVLDKDANPPLPNPIVMQLNNGFGSYRIITVSPVITTPEPSGPVIRELTISSNTLTTYSLYSKFVEKFGTPTSTDSVKLIVNDGIYVVGTDTSQPAIDCTGSWPAGIAITIENRGIIAGRGGNGGGFSGGTAYAGTAGGNGIKAQPTNPVIVQNFGTVAGGGGGSGGVWGTVIGGGSYPQAVGLGGHGGRPLGGAGPKGNGPKSYIWGGVVDGMAGSLTAPGSYRQTSVTGLTIYALSGGQFGAAGDNGAGEGTVRGTGVGGAAGLRSVGPVTINNIGTGAFFGNAG